MTLLADSAAMLPPIRRLRNSRDALLVERDRLSAELGATRRRFDEARISHEALLAERHRLSADLADKARRLALTESFLAEAAATDGGRAVDLLAVRLEHDRIVAERDAALARMSPFSFFNSSFDAEALIRRHAVPGLQATPGFLTNFLGVLVDPNFFPGLLDQYAGVVEGVPIPCNWHTDTAEMAAALRAVEAARETFAMIELGCGWGCWMNITGVAARRRGLAVHLIGVEGDVGHLGFARRAFATNGFSEADYTLFHGIAAGRRGTALFPRQDRAGDSWGSEPLFDLDDAARTAAIASGRYDVLTMHTLGDLAAGHERIDLLHVDIQGGEADLVAASLPVLRDKVAYLLIGTHSRQIEGRLFATLLEAGWELDIERPAILIMTPDGPFTSVDGVQGWRNPNLSGG